MSSVDNPFRIFIQEGGNWGVRDRQQKIRRFIPDSPDQGLDNAFKTNSFNSKPKRGRGRPRKDENMQRSYF